MLEPQEQQHKPAFWHILCPKAVANIRYAFIMVCICQRFRKLCSSL